MTQIKSGWSAAGLAKRKKERQAQITDAGLTLATDRGIQHVTRESVAEATGLGAGTINNHFGNMAQLHTAIMRAAVHRRVLPVIAQGLALKHPQALKAPADIQQQAVATLVRR